MKKEKLNLKSIKNTLTRTELKLIMAGSGGTGGGTGGGNCTPQTIPPATFYCHDSTGYILGHTTTGCCSGTSGALQACQLATYPEFTSYVTGPC